MNVNPNSPQQAPGDKAPVAPASARRTRAAGPDRSASTPAAGRPAGTFELSPRAQQFLKIRARLEALPETAREEKIARLAGLIARGEYAVDGEQIAGAMLKDEAVARMLGLPPEK